MNDSLPPAQRFSSDHDRQQLAARLSPIRPADKGQINRWLAFYQASELQRALVLSHRDLNPFNILWQGAQPWAIDWELAGPIDPLQELLAVASEWSSIGEHWRYDDFCQILNAYQPMPHSCKRVDRALSQVIYSWVDWLAYQLRCYDETASVSALKAIDEALQRLEGLEMNRTVIIETFRHSFYSVDF